MFPSCDIIGVGGFFASVCLTFSCAAIVACRQTRTLAEQFWVVVAVSALQISTLSIALSIVRLLTPGAWLVVQSALTALLILFETRRETFTVLMHRIPRFLRDTVLAGKTVLTSLGSGGIIVFLGLTTLLLIMIGQQILTPVCEFDSRMYHGSRVAYWLQFGSIFPYPTHNDRQVVFPFGAELFFMWPVLFTKTEWLGRVVFGAAYPLLAIGLYTLLREMKVGRPLSLAGASWYLATPVVVWHALPLKPELWSTLFTLGAMFWLVRSCRGEIFTKHELGWSSICAALVINVRTAGLALVPLLLLRSLMSAGSRIVLLCVVLVNLGLGLTLSGFMVTAGHNLICYKNVLGSRALRQVHSSDLSRRQMYTHGVRFLLLMAELPAVPLIKAQNAVTRLGNAVGNRLGASHFLPPEDRTRRWPGCFTYIQSARAHKYSLGGVLWMPALLLGIVTCLFGRSTEGRTTFQEVALALIITAQCLLLILMVFRIRWMAGAYIPERLLVTPYALGVVVTFVLLQRGWCRRWVRVATVLGFLVTVMPVLHAEASVLASKLAYGCDTSLTDEPFAEVLGVIPKGSRILLVASQDCRDYPLFLPRAGFSNHVFSWGKEEFSQQKVSKLIERHSISHVLIENAQEVGFHWDPAVSTVDMAAWLADLPRVHEARFSQGKMRLYDVSHVGLRSGSKDARAY